MNDNNKIKAILENENVVYARRELKRLLQHTDDRKAQEKINDDILDMIKLFVSQGNDGQAAAYEIGVMQRLLSFKPLSPIMGTKEEWGEPEITEDGHKIYQNKRCLSVFKVTDADDKIVDQYDTEAIICSDDGGMSWFTTPKFVRKVQFPYAVPEAPEQVYIKEINGAYVPVTDEVEIEAMYKAAVARKKILQ